MAITNHERVGKAMELLREGLAPFVRRELSDKIKRNQIEKREWDAAALLKLMIENWRNVFRETLGHTERSLVSELLEWRNQWAHQKRISSDDTDRALDSAERLLTAVSAPQATEVATMKRELRRRVLDEQVREQRRANGGGLIEAAGAGALKPWREVVTPHADVASGRYSQAEFAADLGQVHSGQSAAEEYRDPVEFFRRTFLTESLRRLLVGGAQRLAGKGGDPVVQLQTNFGGGKTHSMLALYHLCSGIPAQELTGVDDLLAKAEVEIPSKVRRVVLVGNKISPGNPDTNTKAGGTVVRTLWGELAWQLGGREAFERVRADDENATNPGDVLRELLNEYGPCLVLIDEWVAYARQLHDEADLPGGSFETQFTFAQALTESVKLTDNCLLVISLPASNTSIPSSPRTEADDAEVGGVRGRRALDRLLNVLGRIDSPWKPASAEESFEIVRRRLFEPLAGPDSFTQRNVTARAFAELYRLQQVEFPSECRTTDYERRIQTAYPIHPEIFDRLYEDWSSLARFQRTRGVLRLMAAVIHSLWERGDRHPLLLPSTLPIDDDRVRSELTRYLPDNWNPVIDKDVDGPGSLPVAIDGRAPNLGKLSATRRVARTVYLGSAPTTAAAHRGIDDSRVKLGCVMPGESPAVFGDALRRLAAEATYLYQDGPRQWYATQPTVTKLAEDRAEQLAGNPDVIARELEERLKKDLRSTGDFDRIHTLPRSGADVPDDLDARLVVLSAEHPCSRDPDNAAEVAAREILESRGSTPRLFRNTLVFLAVDKVRYQDLDEALRRYLAWVSILEEKEELNLDPHQARQAETQMKAADEAVTARLPEAYQWLLVPGQGRPDAAVSWQAIRLTAAGALAERAGKRLRNEELLVAGLGATILRKHLDEVPLWRGGDNVAVRQLVEDFGRYLYLPRLRNTEVLTRAVQDGVALLTWESDSFALAESQDEAVGRYRGLQAGQAVGVSPESPALLVKPDVARRQLDAEVPPTPAPVPGGQGPQPGPGPDGTEPPPPPPEKKARRFHGAVTLDATRVGRDAGQIADEVISHLSSLVGAEVTVTLEIDAEIPDGAPENVVRTVTENSRTLKFASHGFEES